MKITITGTDDNTVPLVVDGVSELLVSEAALDTTKDTNDIAAGVKTGTNAASVNETDINTNDLSFQATGEDIASIKFADPNSTTDAFADPAFANLGAGQGTPTWTLSNGDRTLTLYYGSQAALILQLSGANAVTAGNTGNVTVTATLVDHFFHQLPNSTLDVILSGVTVVATDTSGDQVAGTIKVNITDDAPTFGTVTNITVDNEVATTNSTLVVNDGADSPVTASLVGSVPPADLTAGGLAVKYYIDPSNPTVLIGYTGATVTAPATPAVADRVFIVTLNAAGDSYSFQLLKTLDGDVVTTPITASSAFGAGPSAGQVLQDADGNDLASISGWTVPSGFDVAAWKASLTPVSLTLQDVNGSTGGWGVNNNNFDDNGEFLRFDFGSTTDFDGAGPFTPPTINAPNVAEVTFDFKNYSNGDDVDWVVHYSDGTIESGRLTFAGGDFLHTLPPATTGKFIDYVELYAFDGSGKVDLVSAGTVTTAVDITLPFKVTITDTDGDPRDTTVNVRVQEQNDAPVAGADNIVVSNDAFTIPISWLLANDSDPENDSLSVTAVTESIANFTPVVSGGVVTGITVAAGIAVGSYTFTYTLSDGTTTSTGNVTMSVVNTDSNINTIVVPSAVDFSRIDGNDGNDPLTGGAGTDILIGGNGDDVLTGGQGNDNLQGGANNDTYSFAAGAGNDQVTDSSGSADRIGFGITGMLANLNFLDTDLDDDGGGDDDNDDLLISYNGQSISVINHFDTGTIEQLILPAGLSVGGYALNSSGYRISTDDNGTFDGVNDVAFGSRDIIAGNSLAQTLSGGAGDDLLFGNGGNDTLNGGDGSDLLVGGTGQDTLSGGNGRDYFKLTDTASFDIISDYQTGANSDFVDLTSLVTVAAGHSVSEYITRSGSDLFVDIDGNGTGATAVKVAQFTANPASGALAVIYEDAAHTVLTQNF